MSPPTESVKNVCMVCSAIIDKDNQDQVERCDLYFHLGCLANLSKCPDCSKNVYYTRELRCLNCKSAVPRIECSQCKKGRTEGTVRKGLFVCQTCERARQKAEELAEIERKKQYSYQGGHGCARCPGQQYCTCVDPN